MKVKELPEDTNITNIKVILPDDVLKKYQDYLGGEKEMYIVGPIQGDFFMSPIKPGEEERRLYPLPMGVLPEDMLEWETAES